MTPPRYCVLGAGRGSAELIDFIAEAGGGDVVVLDDHFRRVPTGAPNGPSGVVQASGVPVGDRAASALPDVAGAHVVGPLSDAARHAAAGARVLSGIANARTMGVRLDIARKAALADDAWATFIHPASHVSARARVGRGSVIYPGACVAINAHVGAHALLYYNVVVHHDVVIEDGVILCAGVLVAGSARVGTGSYLGVGAVVRDGVRIGARALVGMGAVVTRDVPDGAVVVGVPARA